MAALAIPAAGDPALQGAWAVVTGGTRGIGLEVARGLVSRGIHVLIVGRDAGAGKAAAESLGRSAAGGAQARFEAGDLSRLGEVPALARRIAGIVPRLKYLIHNAAVVTPRRLVTPEGFETQFAVNHLAPYSLTRDLIPALLSAPEARIVVTASQVERGADLDLDDLMGSKGYEPFRAYGQSKLANVLFTYELAERLAGSSVTVNCLHPGVVRTGLLDTLGAVQTANQPRESAVRRVVGALRRSIGSGLGAAGLRPPVKDWALAAPEGAVTTLTVTLAPELRGVSGRYFSDCQEATSSPRSRDPALRRALWEASARLLDVSPDWPDRRSGAPAPLRS